MTTQFSSIAEGAVLLTVNRRLARHQTACYQQWQAEQGSLWWETPAIVPMTSWFSSVHSEALAAGLSQRAQVPELVVMRSWRDCIEQDRDAGLLDINAAASLACNSWQLSHLWRCWNDETRYLSQDQLSWQRWQQRYRRWLDEQGLVDAVTLPDELLQMFRAEPEPAKKLLPEKIILDGFLVLPPQYQELLEQIESLGTVVEHLVQKPRTVPVWQSFPDEHAELLGIASQMRSELEQDESQNLGLIIGNLQQRRATVLRAFDQVFFPCLSPDEITHAGRPYDLSIGLPLSEQAIVSIALDLLALSFGTIRDAAISRVLLSPYLTASETEAAARQSLDRRLRDERISTLDLHLLQKTLHSSMALHHRLSELRTIRQSGDASLSEWASRFDQCLTCLGWPGRIGSEEHQAHAAWMDCLDDLQLLDDGRSLSVSAALQELRSLTGERIFQPEVADAPIQIMGRLESHGLAFDQLWIAGLDDENWPPVGTADPFLDISEQRRCAIPQASAEARLDMAHREFGLWQSQTSTLRVSYAASRDGKSMVAARISSDKAAAGHAPMAIDTVAQPLHRIKESVNLQVLEDLYGPGLPESSQVPGGARLFEDQALCPFRGFARHRLGIRRLEEPGAGLDPRQHGNALHTSLELFWKQTGSHESLLALSEDQLQQRVNEVVESALSEIDMTAALRSLEQTRLSGLLLQWLQDNEKPRVPFHVEALEQKQTVVHGGIEMTVILDRIDRIDDDLLVIDYKSGKDNRIVSWAEPRIRNPQLPLYVLSDQRITGAAFAQVVASQKRFLGVADNDALLTGVKRTITRRKAADDTREVPGTWSQWREHWQSALDIVASEVREGLASVTPIDGACQHCELKPFCRISDQLPTDTSADTDEAGSI